MNNLVGKWTSWKYTILSLVLTFVIKVVYGFTMSRQAISVGIIGGVDGPTSIYVACGYLHYIAWIIIFGILLTFYKPMKRLLNDGSPKS